MGHYSTTVTGGGIGVEDSFGSGGVAKAVAVYFSNRLKQCKGSTLSIVSRRKIEKEV